MKKLTTVTTLFVLVTFGSAGAWASQPSKFWVVPAVGIRTTTSFGIDSEETEYTRIRFSKGIAYGLSVGFQLSEYLSLEAGWSRHSPDVHGMIPTDGTPTYEMLFQASEDQLQANLMIWAGYKIGPVKPYFLAGLGLTKINPGGDITGVSRISWSLGTGFETPISDRFLIRVQGKFVPIYIKLTDELLTEWVGGFEASPSRNSMTQWELTAGLVVRF
jgi:opacity protein-like surface antigen